MIKKKFKEANRNSEAEKYNNKNKKFTRGVQWQIWIGRRNNQLSEDRKIEIIQSEEQKEKE